jgi:hypothetical protein
MLFANLIGVKMAISKDVRLCRVVRVIEQKAGERLVAALIKGEEYCQRCTQGGMCE